MNLTYIIEDVQAKLGITADGKAGPETWQAIHRAIVGGAGVVRISAQTDPRSAKNIATLKPEVQAMALALIEQAAEAGIEIRIISGTRTFAEQDVLFSQGRSKAGKIVTNAQGGYSNHNFGIAFDVGVFEGGKYLAESPKYKAVGALGIALGLEWGGNWKTIQDEPHFQLRPSWATGMTERDMLARLRKEAGK